MAEAEALGKKKKTGMPNRLLLHQVLDPVVRGNPVRVCLFGWCKFEFLFAVPTPDDGQIIVPPPSLPLKEEEEEEAVEAKVVVEEVLQPENINSEEEETLTALSSELPGSYVKHRPNPTRILSVRPIRPCHALDRRDPRRHLQPQQAYLGRGHRGN